MLSILYSKYAPDAITNAILRMSHGHYAINNICLEDCIQQGEWQADPSGRFIFKLPQTVAQQLANTHYLINRAFIYDASLQTEKDFPPDVIQLETECHFRQCIEAVKQASARAGLYGLCGDYLPLYLQWKRVRATNLNVKLPRYDYAFGSLRPDVKDFVTTVYKSPFDLRTWRPNSPPEQDWHTFVVERPKGSAVIAILVNNSVLLNTELDSKTAELVRHYSRELGHLFGSCFGEILYFIEDDIITFAAFSHIVSKQFSEDSMDRVMDKELALWE